MRFMVRSQCAYSLALATVGHMRLFTSELRGRANFTAGRKDSTLTACKAASVHKARRLEPEAAAAAPSMASTHKTASA